MSVVAPEMRSAWLPTRLERASRSAPAAGGRQLLSMHQHHPTCKGLTYVVDSAHHVALVALPPAPPWDVLPKKPFFTLEKCFTNGGRVDLGVLVLHAGCVEVVNNY